MNTLTADIQKAVQLARWQRLLRKRDSKRTPARILMTIVFGILFLISIGSASVSPLVAVRGNQVEMDGFVIMASVLAGSFLLYLQLVVTYQRVVMEDSSILLVAPITGRAILLFRFFDNFPTTLLFSLLGLPMTAVYLWNSHAQWVAYPLAVIALWVSTWLVAGFAVFLMAIVIRLIRRPISRDVLGVISSIVAIGILLGSRVLAHNALGTSGQALSGHLFSSWLAPRYIYFPLSWFGHGLVGWGHQSMLGLAYLLLTLLAVLLILNLAVAIASPILHERLTQLSDVGTTGRRRSRPSRSSSRRHDAEGTGTPQGSEAQTPGLSEEPGESDVQSPGGAEAWTTRVSGASGASEVQASVASGPRVSASVGGPREDSQTSQGLKGQRAASKTKKPNMRLIWEITRKDLLRLRRTPVDLASYLFPTAYLLYFITQPQQAGGMGAMLGLLPVFILILASTMGRVPISSFGTEGEQVWLYLQAPTPSNAVLWAKWLFGTLPTLVWWEVLCILLTVFHAMTPGLALLLGVSGIWLIPGAVALTLPFAIHGAAFIPRLVGRRNRYVNGRSSWYILVIFPYLILQLIPLGAVTVVLVPTIKAGGKVGALLTQFQQMTWMVGVGLVLSVLLAGVGMLVGRSMGLEAWRHKRVELYETGALDGSNSSS